MRQWNWIGLVIAIATAGCSSDNTSARVAELNTLNIQKVANLYAAYQMRSGTGPKDAAALKEFVAGGGISPGRLELMHIDPKNLDPLFTSDRDHKLFKIKPGVEFSPRAISAVVFEETGLDGKRLVALSNSTVLEADDAKYKELWESKAAAPPDPEAAAAAAAKKEG